jgi:hypothetical protein
VSQAAAGRQLADRQRAGRGFVLLVHPPTVRRDSALDLNLT